MKCKDCPYCYKTDEDDFPCCQFRRIAPYDPAPCEYEDWELQIAGYQDRMTEGDGDEY